ncbi:hypothetical protein EHQ12_05150 [Leptospira gomenensis]|uniref:Uncharacterized protein n=1 Tax=Leptospira gomenensis TaxID=2484974 RepID=A0A5F1YEW4_9LEPT|nr:hypothetical protein [Leptospira gomenensis]TGK36381.1 hypothetical protein EHQ17_04340 [Leptospira gomenensis]TGK42030.1 hypothetical protein EHQ12_05150 [Leptospira gomenensis]TGK48887.1 hypothetical protein EHQ07_05470 [Leptospira gomenensis]TGK58014.1 hypothetical protein EHQ13_14505 [Leptospira gomenensis]
MFIGHYSVAFVLKKAVPKTPFWFLLAGVQFVDILFMCFVMIGIEHMRLIPGFTQSNPFDLYYMPYTHSLAAAFFWGIAAFGLFYVWFPARSASVKRNTSLAVGFSVISHYFLDLPVHTPDLPLLFDSGPKLGFGLWNHLWLTIGIETAITLVAFVYYLRGSSSGEGFAGRWGMILYAFFFLVLIIANPFTPTPDNVYAFSIQALFLYGLIAYLGHKLDSMRKYRESKI